MKIKKTGDENQKDGDENQKDGDENKKLGMKMKNSLPDLGKIQPRPPFNNLKHLPLLSFSAEIDPLIQGKSKT